jgi:phosphoribosylcarboxyaminoimidazole (NCAIR) mutase
MPTAAQDAAQLAADEETLAGVDYATISAFIATNGAAATSLQAAAQALVPAIGDPIRQQQAQGLANDFGQVISGYANLLSATQAAETNPPPA